MPNGHSVQKNLMKRYGHGVSGYRRVHSRSVSAKRKIRHTRMDIPYEILALHKYVDEEVRLCGRSLRYMCRLIAIFTLTFRITPDTAGRYVNSATFVAAFIHSSNTDKRKIRHTRMSMPYFWRRWRDLNSRADCSTYTLSRGASSPLEYISVW